MIIIGNKNQKPSRGQRVLGNIAVESTLTSLISCDCSKIHWAACFNKALSKSDLQIRWILRLKLYSFKMQQEIQYYIISILRISIIIFILITLCKKLYESMFYWVITLGQFLMTRSIQNTKGLIISIKEYTGIFFIHQRIVQFVLLV